jgi:hypothetical protein
VHPSVRVCLPDLNRSVAQRLSFQVRDATAQLHELAGSPLMMSAHKRQVGVPITRLYHGGRTDRLSGLPSLDERVLVIRGRRDDRCDPEQGAPQKHPYTGLPLRF